MTVVNAPLAVRAYREGDRDEVIALWDAVFVDSYPFLLPRFSPSALRPFFLDGAPRATRVFVAHEEDALVGFFALRRDYLSQLYVAVSAQRRGIGSALLTAAQARSIGPIWLRTFARNEGARRFYERHAMTPRAASHCRVTGELEIEYRRAGRP